MNETFQSELASEIRERKEELAKEVAESQGIPRRYTESEIEWLTEPLENHEEFLDKAHPAKDVEDVLGESEGVVGLELPSVPVLYLMTVTRQLMAGNEIRAKIKEDNQEFLEEIIEIYESVADQVEGVENPEEMIHFDSWDHTNLEKTREFLEETNRSYTFTGDQAALMKERQLEELSFEDHQTIFAEGYSGAVLLPDTKVEDINELVESFTWANGLYCENTGYLAFPVEEESVVEDIADEAEDLNLGDPVDPDTDIGTFSENLRDEFQEYIDKVERMGYEVVTGGEVEEKSIQPTVIKVPRDKGESYRKIDDDLVFPDNMFPMVFAFPYDELEHAAKKIESATNESYRGHPLSLAIFGGDDGDIDYVKENIQAETYHVNEGTHRVDTMEPHEGEWLVDYI